MGGWVAGREGGGWLAGGTGRPVLGNLAGRGAATGLQEIEQEEDINRARE